jgi:2-oxoglutarate dehydrogenase complex dehydrogenase (E1) component-like enzyme
VSGKLYYDLLKAREASRTSDVGLMRIERLYPFPSAELGRVLAGYPQGAELVWAQEEPRNMGAWRFVRERFLDGDVPDSAGRVPRYAGRPASASPAAGSHKIHVAEQEAVVKAALEG